MPSYLAPGTACIAFRFASSRSQLCAARLSGLCQEVAPGGYLSEEISPGLIDAGEPLSGRIDQSAHAGPQRHSAAPLAVLAGSRELCGWVRQSVGSERSLALGHP